MAAPHSLPAAPPLRRRVVPLSARLLACSLAHSLILNKKRTQWTDQWQELAESPFINDAVERRDRIQKLVAYEKVSKQQKAKIDHLQETVKTHHAAKLTLRKQVAELRADNEILTQVHHCPLPPRARPPARRPPGQSPPPPSPVASHPRCPSAHASALLACVTFCGGFFFGAEMRDAAERAAAAQADHRRAGEPREALLR